MTNVASVLVLAALVGLFAGAPLSMIHRRTGYATTLVASVLLVAAAILVLAGGPVTALSWSGVIGEPESIRLDGLSAFFALTAGVVWIGTSAFSLDYDRHATPWLAVAYSLTLGSIAIVLTSTNFLVFLAGWEAMTLASYWMILEATGRPSRIFSAAFVFLAFGEASSLLIAVAIA
ncbi:hydrogenase 4 subunit B, partial [mine drainage metagenome]